MTKKCIKHHNQYAEFQENDNDESTNYERHLYIEKHSDRMCAILDLRSDDRQFVKATYKYSVHTLPRPQDKQKTKKDSPADPEGQALQTKTRLEWLQFLKVCNCPPSPLIPITSSSTFFFII